MHVFLVICKSPYIKGFLLFTFFFTSTLFSQKLRLIRYRHINLPLTLIQ
jgi:hypothetical protein